MMAERSVSLRKPLSIINLYCYMSICTAYMYVAQLKYVSYSLKMVWLENCVYPGKKFGTLTHIPSSSFYTCPPIKKHVSTHCLFAQNR